MELLRGHYEVSLVGYFLTSRALEWEISLLVKFLSTMTLGDEQWLFNICRLSNNIYHIEFFTTEILCYHMTLSCSPHWYRGRVFSLSKTIGFKKLFEDSNKKVSHFFFHAQYINKSITTCSNQSEDLLLNDNDSAWLILLMKNIFSMSSVL